MGIMWFVTALIGVAAVILISQLINENRILQYFGRISLIILCIHGPVYRIVVKNCINSVECGYRCSERKFSTGHGSGSYYDGNMQYGI